MCGIVGYSLKVPARMAVGKLALAKDLLSHRGPDDSGLFEEPEASIGLAHTRLSILDLSPLGHQPMFSEDGSVALVFNGEIYNFRELRAELEAAGYLFRSRSDTEVLLNLYLDCRARGGDLAKTLRRLNGIFAFALWDSQNGAMLLVRDAFGVKPLYFFTDSGRLAFASEIKALLPLVDNEIGQLDKESLYRYMTFLWCPGEGTPFMNVKKIGPGELMWVRNGEIAKKEVWYQLPAFRYASSAMEIPAAACELKQHLRTAVHRQLVADVPVGAFLSGGLDSSTVVTFAREQNPNIICFTIDSSVNLEADKNDDLTYALRVAKHLGVQLEVVRVNDAMMVQDLVDMVIKLDEPLGDPAALNVMYISSLARELGIKVLLSGVGGDDILSGYRRHFALSLESYWKWLPISARKGLASLVGSLNYPFSWQRNINKAFNGAALEGDSRLVNYFAWSKRDDLLALCTPDFRAAINEVDASWPMIEFSLHLPSNLSPMERMLALEQRFFLGDHNLIYTDKMSMSNGVEVRVPFLDLDLVEFVQRIPPQLKQRGTNGKWLLKKAMEPYLPKEIIYRKKIGFALPLRSWIREGLSEFLSDTLSESGLRKRGLFDPVSVRKLIADNQANRIDASYTLFSLLCIELWCRAFMDKAYERSSII